MANGEWSSLGSRRRIALMLFLCAYAATGHARQMTSKILLSQFLEAVNSRDESRIRGFLEKNAAGNVPIEQRVARIRGMAENGAPFKIVQPGTEVGDSLRAIIEDKNGRKLGLIMDLQKSAEPKMLALRLGPPDMLDSPPAKDYSGWKDLDSLGASLRADTQSPAIGIAVLRDGRLEQTASGLRKTGGSSQVMVDDPWSIGSIGKSIAATIVGRLIEMGRLRWDMTLGDALADIPMKAGYKDATLEQIMHHRGGIPQDLGFTRDRVDAIIGAAAGSQKTAWDPMKMRENYARDILGREPIAVPGQHFAYSNAGYALLGVVAERIMKKPYEILVHELVFEPLGLKHSYTAMDKLPESRPSGHVPGSQGLRPENMSGPLEILVAPTGGGLFMSIADLVHFGEAHLKGLRGQDGLLKAETIQRLHQGIPEEPGAPLLYACGWGIEAFPGMETMHTHNGSNGTFRSQLSIFPDANLVVACMVNRGGESDPSPPLQAVLAVAKRYAPKRP